MVELLIARNPDPESSLPYLLWVPLGNGLVFRARDVWPRTKAVYLHPVWLDEWPDSPEIVDRAAVRSCVRRGAAIDLILDRGRENRSQIVYTTARGREMVFWQSPRTRKQARPNVSVPRARAAALPDLAIIVDSYERYAYKFSDKAVTVVRQALTCGDYGIQRDGRLLASVERKSLPDLVTSLVSGRLRFAIAELAALPNAAVVVEDRYSQIFAQTHFRPAALADMLAELQVRYPSVPIVFCETRKLAEEWTYRFLAAAHVWSEAISGASGSAAEGALAALVAQDGRDGRDGTAPIPLQPLADQPSTAEVRTWARRSGIAVPDRGRLRPEVIAAWRQAHGR
ncbi:MAG TPA: ERCC4 domain-containing protein [Streptosporangiaceae bacterium]|nr:ERCC4 domain-containing protein [Streptosporangiaceae bacterium]